MLLLNFIIWEERIRITNDLCITFYCIYSLLGQHQSQMYVQVSSQVTKQITNWSPMEKVPSVYWKPYLASCEYTQFQIFIKKK